MGAYRPNSAGIRQMLNSRDVLGGGLIAAGEMIRTEAAATAPYDAKSRGPHFRDSFHVQLVTDDGNKGKRLAAEVYSTDPEGFRKESGTKNTPAHNTLNHALDVLGKVRK